MKKNESKLNLVENMSKNEDRDLESKAARRGVLSTQQTVEDRVLTPDEKSFLLCVERGDVASSKRIVLAMKKRPTLFDINCVDPLGRSALIISVENENTDMMEMLLEMGILPKDALLVAIREDYVDGVDILLRHEEESHKEGEPYSWESMVDSVANFTQDITPLILAAHRNNYEILKMLLDRGATVPVPHDVKCSCDECIKLSAEDSLKFSLSRINAYKALASPSLIALSSSDPILSAFQLSEELKRLAFAESQFREEYVNLRKQVQDFVSGLVSQARTSYELEVILNHNPDGEPWQIGDFQTLERLKLAIDTRQKDFVAHPSVQQLLASIWYEGLPGFRRRTMISQLTEVMKLACKFPINSMIYILAPNSKGGKFMRNPFVKFISHSSSYLFFLLLLALASQRIEHVMMSLICFLVPGTEWLAEFQADLIKHERGSLPMPVEMLIVIWIQGLIWVELKALWKDGLVSYITQLWNLADIFSYGSFLSWIGLRALEFLIVQKMKWDGVDPEDIWIPKEQWHPYEPQLLAEAMFGAGMVGSYLKVVYILSINPYLGPLQIALGKMVMDIIKWMFLYILVVFAFGCGMNQLLWYYADLERQECYSLPGGLPDTDSESCVMYRRFANLWEASQSLFWASFGLVELPDFELKGIQEFTRFWGLLMFGSYSVCNIIVLLNMLIAMMSNSYQIIHERSDTEWKYSRSKLWISYFNPGSTVPAPFNLIPSPKSIKKILTCQKSKGKSYTEEEVHEANLRYTNVMKFIIRRYVTAEQRKSEDFTITEDDIQEVRQDINSFKYELLDILKSNNMVVPNQKKADGIVGRKSKEMERKIQKGFNVQPIEGVMQAFFSASQESKSSKDMFKKFAKAVNEKEKIKRRNEEGRRRSSLKRDPIGSREASIRRHQSSLKKSLFERGNSQQDIKMVLTRLNSEELVAFNPILSEYPPTVRRAYARFKSVANEKAEEKKGKSSKDSDPKKTSAHRSSIKKLIIEKAKSIEKEASSAQKTAADLEKVLDPKETGEKKIDPVGEVKKTDVSKPEPTTGTHAKPVESSQPPTNLEDKGKTEKPKDEPSKPVQPPSKDDKSKTSPPGSKEADKVSKPGEGKVNEGFVPDEPTTAPKKEVEKAPTPKPAKSTTEKDTTPKPSETKEPQKKISPDDLPPSKLGKQPSPKPTTAANVVEPVGKFDPDGKSAVSGQKRTGWI